MGVAVRCASAAAAAAVDTSAAASTQGLTFVHVSARLEHFYGIRGARRGCVARVKGALGGV